MHVDVEIRLADILVLQHIGHLLGDGALFIAGELTVEVLAVLRHDIGPALDKGTVVDRMENDQLAGNLLRVQLLRQLHGAGDAGVLTPVNAAGE